METLMHDKKISIIGGGPVGLTTARLLQQQRASVVVYERDAHGQARMLGSTLDIHQDTGQKAIEAAGLLAELYKLVRPTTERMGDRESNILFEMAPHATNLYSHPEIDRPDLRSLLLNSLKENTVVWNAQTVGITEHDGTFTIQFRSGKTATADLVIIADGAMSKARRFITDSVPAPTGTFCIEGEIFTPAKNAPIFYERVNNGNLAILQDKKSLFIHTKGNGHFNYYATFRATGDWMEDNGVDFEVNSTVEKFLNKLFADWSTKFSELFRATDEFRGFPLRVFSTFDSWKPHANITLVGDAAHVIPPFDGLGVNLGLLDALMLTENLTSDRFTSTKAAIAAYEKQMMETIAPLLVQTKEADDRIHTQTGIAAERMERMSKFKDKLNGKNQ